MGLVITWPSKHTLFQSKLWQSLQHEIIYQKATTNPNIDQEILEFIDQEILEYHWHQWNVQQRLLWQYYNETVNGEWIHQDHTSSKMDYQTNSFLIMLSLVRIALFMTGCRIFFYLSRDLPFPHVFII